MRLKLRHIMCLMVLLTGALSALAQQAVTQITGLVRDSLSHEGVSYATITLVGTDEGTIANEKGGFTINSRAAFSKLRVTAMGYTPREVSIKAGQGNVLLIDLLPSGVELGEVVVRKGKEKYSKKNNPAVEMIKKLSRRND